jgi:hypothetical protein
MSESNLVRMTGLWKSETDSGETCLSGAVGPTSRIVVLPNRNSGGSAPDFIAYMAPNGERSDEQEQDDDDAFEGL